MRVFSPRSFFRLLGICKGDYCLTTELCRQELIGIAPCEVVRHGRWHSVFCDLTEKKKDAIRRWRDEKEEAKNECLRLSEKENRNLQRAPEEKEKKDHESRLQREVQRQLVQAWQREKAEETAKKRETVQKEKEIQKKEQQISRAMQLEKKKSVHAYKERKKV